MPPVSVSFHLRFTLSTEQHKNGDSLKNLKLIKIVQFWIFNSDGGHFLKLQRHVISIVNWSTFYQSGQLEKPRYQLLSKSKNIICDRDGGRYILLIVNWATDFSSRLEILTVMVDILQINGFKHIVQIIISAAQY